MPGRLVPVLLAALLVAHSAAQENPAGVLALHPPSAAERVPPGTELFLVFGRDRDMASAWELRPGTDSLVKRCDFARSRLSPRRLRPDLPVELVRVHERTGRKSVEKRYLVDYRTWRVKPLDVPLDRNTRVMGRAGAAVYVWLRDPGADQEVLHRLDLQTGDLMRFSPPFWKVIDIGPFWLVRHEGVDRAYALLNTGDEKVVQDTRLPPALCGLTYRRFTHPATSPDGRHVAWMTGLDWEALWKLPEEQRIPLITSRLPSSVMVLDLETGRTREAPIWFLGVWSSAGWAVRHEIDLRFLDDGRLTYLSVTEGAPDDLAEAVDAGRVERVVMDLKTGQVQRTPAKKGERPGPEKCLDEPEAPGITDRSARIHEFLARHHVIPPDVPTRMYPSAFTADGRRFLAYVRGTGFLAGDFQEDRLTRVKAGDIKLPVFYAVRIAQ